MRARHESPGYSHRSGGSGLRPAQCGAAVSGGHDPHCPAHWEMTLSADIGKVVGSFFCDKVRVGPNAMTLLEVPRGQVRENNLNPVQSFFLLRP